MKSDRIAVIAIRFVVPQLCATFAAEPVLAFFTTASASDCGGSAGTARWHQAQPDDLAAGNEPGRPVCYRYPTRCAQLFQQATLRNGGEPLVSLPAKQRKLPPLRTRERNAKSMKPY